MCFFLCFFFQKKQTFFSKAHLFIIVPPESPRTSENHLGMPFSTGPLWHYHGWSQGHLRQEIKIRAPQKELKNSEMNLDFKEKNDQLKIGVFFEITLFFIQILTSLRIMGSQNWCFGDPMQNPPTKESHLGPLYFGGSSRWFLGRINDSRNLTIIKLKLETFHKWSDVVFR